MNLGQYAAATGTTPAAFRKKLRDHGVNVTHEAVRGWFNGDLQPSPKKIPAIEAATDGRVTRYHQRPDIYGKPPKAKATKRRRAA